MADFAADVARWVEKAKGRADAAFRGTAEAALARVKELTPVRTGNLRANWQITLGGEAVRTLANDNPDNPLSAVVTEARIGQVLLITNPVSYARPIEFGYQRETKAGTVEVSGRFMLTQTMAELPQIAERVAREVVRSSP